MKTMRRVDIPRTLTFATAFAAGVALIGSCELQPSMDVSHSNSAARAESAPVGAAAVASAAGPAEESTPSRLALAGIAEPHDSSPVNQPGFANLDPEDDFVEGPPEAISDCEARLEAAHVKFRAASLPVFKKKNLTCGAPQVVQYLHGPTKLRIQPSPLVTCQLALALARFEAVANRTAKEVLGSEIAAITQGGTFNCRSMARFKIISEHSFANAIDIFAFRLANGRSIPVLRYFGDPKQPATTVEGRFLRLLANRLFDENVCSVVVTRFYDELHRDHIHCDMARYHVDGSR